MVISPLLLEGREEEHKFCVKPKKNSIRPTYARKELKEQTGLL
jgi:hypothetical protein